MRSRGSREKRAFLAVLFCLCAASSWRVPTSSDGLLVLRTAASLAFQGTFSLPPPPPGASVVTYFFRPSPDGKGMVQVYQPFGALWRAGVLRTALFLPAGPVRGFFADIGLSLVPVLLMALTVFPLSRLLRAGGASARHAPAGAAAVLLGSFLGPLGTTDFNEPAFVWILVWSLDRARLSHVLFRRSRRAREAFLAGLLGVAAMLVKPAAVAAFPAIGLLVVMAPRSAKRPSLERILPAAAGVLLSTLVFVGFSVWRTGRLLEFGYFDQPFSQAVSPPWTVVRLTLLPNRGLLWFAPLIVLMFWGTIQLLRKECRRPQAVSALLGLLGFLSVNVSYWLWDGGMSWGPRYTAPAFALFALTLGPALGRHRRTVAFLATAGIALNMPGYLIDSNRIYDYASQLPPVHKVWGPIVPVHRDVKSPEGIFDLQRVHYVPALAPVFAGQRVLWKFVLEGDSSAIGQAPPGAGVRNDSAFFRLLLGRELPFDSCSGRVLLEEAIVTLPVDPVRALTFCKLSIGFDGPPVDTRAVGAVAAYRAQRFDEAMRLAEEGLRLDPKRPDLLGSLEAARRARVSNPPEKK
ncbi:MAG: hypothetical protein IT186_18310 [Acidobacteria bacterium]|nr:hypothetical protein [Acidobacteriota bacterium]